MTSEPENKEALQELRCDVEEELQELRWHVEASLEELEEAVENLFADSLNDLRHCVFHQIHGRVGWRILLDGWVVHRDWPFGTDDLPGLSPFTYYLGDFVNWTLDSAKATAAARLDAVHKHLSANTSTSLDDGASKVVLEWHDYRATPVIRRIGVAGVIRCNEIVWRPETVTDTDRATAKLKIYQLQADYSEHARADNYSSMRGLIEEVARLEFLYLIDGKSERCANLRNAEQRDFPPTLPPSALGQLETVAL